MTFQQKKSSDFKFKLNFDSLLSQHNLQNSQNPLFLTSRTNKKDEKTGFNTERLKIDDDILGFGRNFTMGNSYNFVKNSDYFHTKLQYKEQRPRNFTLNELQFKEKFLRNKRRASEQQFLNNSSTSHQRPSSLSVKRTVKNPEFSFKVLTPKPNKKRISSNKSQFTQNKQKKMLNKDQVSVFNNILESNTISEIIKEDPKSFLKINPKLFRNFNKSINLSKNPENNEYLFKLVQKGHEKALLRYKPIVKADLTVNKTENLNNFATDKELDLYNYGYAQMDLCGDNKRSLETLKKEKDYQETKQECQSISSRISQNISEKPKNEKFFDNIQPFSGPRLALSQIQYLKGEFMKPKNAADFEKIDFILKNLKFFTKFSQTIRMHFIKRAKFVEFPSQHIIFNEGDFGDLMYVILRGSVNIRILKTIDIYEGISSSHVVNSFYDGDHFGDLAMMSMKKSQNVLKSKTLVNNISRMKDVRQYLQKCELILHGEKININKESEKEYLGIKENEEKKTVERTKRAATIETVEQCFFLTLGREEYQYIYNNILQKSLEDKLNVLMTGHFFEGIEMYNLLPFANAIEEKVFYINNLNS